MNCCDDDGYVDCTACGGDGYFLKQAFETGELFEDDCPECGGRGWLVCLCGAA